MGRRAVLSGARNRSSPPQSRPTAQATTHDVVVMAALLAMLQAMNKPVACSVEGCDRPILSRGWCRKHYLRWKRRGGDPAVGLAMRQAKTCSVDGCTNPTQARGWCAKHYARWKRKADVLLGPRSSVLPFCVVEGCSNRPHAQGLCAKHYMRLRRHGNPLVLVRQSQRRLVCSVESCDRPTCARGLCMRHYKQGRRKALTQQRQ